MQEQTVGFILDTIHNMTLMLQNFPNYSEIGPKSDDYSMDQNTPNDNINESLDTQILYLQNLKNQRK